jgi:hypothetical protein
MLFTPLVETVSFLQSSETANQHKRRKLALPCKPLDKESTDFGFYGIPFDPDFGKVKRSIP